MKNKYLIVAVIAIIMLFTVVFAINGSPIEHIRIRNTIKNYLGERYTFPTKIISIEKDFKLSTYMVKVQNTSNHIVFSVNKEGKSDNYFQQYWCNWMEKECQPILDGIFGEGQDIYVSIPINNEEFKEYRGDQIPSYKDFIAKKAAYNVIKLDFVINKTFDESEDIPKIFQLLTKVYGTEISYDKLGIYFKQSDESEITMKYFRFSAEELRTIVENNYLEQIISKINVGGANAPNIDN